MGLYQKCQTCPTIQNVDLSFACKTNMRIDIKPVSFFDDDDYTFGDMNQGGALYSQMRYRD